MADLYAVWISFGDWFKDMYFPDRQNWNQPIVLRQEETGGTGDASIAARVLDERMYIAPARLLEWKAAGTARECEVKPDTLYYFREVSRGLDVAVIIKKCSREWLAFEKFVMPARRVVIGRSDIADVRDVDSLMSSEHGYLNASGNNAMEYRDHSSNGTYLNGRSISGSSVRLAFGDVLTFPTGLKIVCLGKCLAVNHISALKSMRLEKWHDKPQPRRADDGGEHEVVIEYQRAPRMLKKCQAENVEIEPPIPKQVQQQMPLFLQIGPSMTMILPMLMGTMVASGGSNMLSSGVAMIGTSSLLGVMWGIVNRRYRKSQERTVETRRTGLYRQYISETEAALSEMNALERRRLIDIFPDMAQCAGLPYDNVRRLWDRMPTHPDFLTVRIGTGSVAMPCEISVPQQKLSIIDDELRQEPGRLKSMYSIINDAPVTIPLRRETVLGVLGGTQAVLFAQGLLMQLAALHSYHDVRIAVLTDESGASQWEWTRWLPHVFATEDRELRMVASEPGDIHDVVSYLDEVLALRKADKNNADSADNAEDADNSDALLPHYVIFCTNLRLLDDEPIMRQLLTGKMGMTLIMVAAGMENLPKESHLVLNMNGATGYMHTSEGDTQNVDFEYPDRGLLKSFSRGIAPMRVRDVAESAAIPSLVSFLDIYSVRRVEELDVWRMWSENHTYNGIRSVIGYRAGSQPFILDISDKYHGPHGLIAGTTGSGKSVMLETYILSLALNYSPRQVQLILIDYKGGGMADAFRELPHVAGIIDNLQGERVIGRALASLNGEIHRREAIFHASGVNSINDYNQQYGEAEGTVLPHLIIIVDEFAELKSEQPDFMREVVSASRVGRSLGIHLILATQKPSNSVSDEIWANSRFHLCLRVQTRQDSMEMLKRPDAAYIKGMGRCFIQIGNDELFEQVQTSYSGLAYRPDEPRAEEMPQLISPIGHVVRVPKKPRREGGEKGGKEKTQMDAVLGHLMEVSQRHGMSRMRMMWLPELPSHIYLKDIALFRRMCRYDGRYLNPTDGVRVLTGIADDVARQRYLPYVVNLTEIHNLMAAGLAGTGKTTLVQSMVYSMCCCFDPAHLSIYILSLTSQTLGSLADFPQVGDIMFEDDAIEIKRLLNMLAAETARRAELFANSATDSFVEFNTTRVRRGEAPEPAIVVFIDRFEQLKTMFANDEFYMNRINTLIREGSGRGVHFVVTAMSVNEVPARLHSFFGGLALQLRERSDYSECIGKRLPYEMPPIAALNGRGVGLMDGQPYEIQFALGGGAAVHEGEGFESAQNTDAYAITQGIADTGALSDVERAEDIAACAREMSAQWSGRVPQRVPRIPEKPNFEIMSAESGFAEALREDFSMPVGYDMVSGKIKTIDLDDNPSWLVYGPKRSGISNFLKLTARVMAARHADVYIIGGQEWKSTALAAGAQLMTEPQEISDFLDMFIRKYCVTRKTLRNAAVERGRAAARRQAAEFGACCLIVDNAERLYREFSQEANKDKLPKVQGLLGEIAEKPHYNFSLFMGISASERAACQYEPLKKLIEQGRGVALGGRLHEFDPCGVGGALPAQIRARALPMGQGCIGANGECGQIVVPVSEDE